MLHVDMPKEAIPGVIVVYETEEGRVPFLEWLDGIRE